MDKKFWATTFTLSGTIMGAGILGLPFVFAKSGFLVGLFWLIFLGVVMTFINLSLGEVILRTNGKHQLSGYAGRYLGVWAKRAMLFGMLFGIYSALLAYLIGVGESISKLLSGDINSFVLGLAFWLVMTLFLREGLKGLKKIETYGVIAIIVIVIGIFMKFLSQIQFTNLFVINTNNLTFPIGVILFSLLGFVSIPELRQEIKEKEKQFRRAILLGSLIPIILYVLFTSVFVGILGENVTPVATLSFGPFITLLGIFTMLTSFFVLSFSLKDSFKYDFKLSKRLNFFFTSLVPLIIYVLVYLFEFNSFVLILGIGGVISGGVTGILILLMNIKSKDCTRNGKNPEIIVPMNWFLFILLSIIFIVGIILEFV